MADGRELVDQGWTTLPQLVTSDEVMAIRRDCDVLFAHRNGLEQRLPLVADIVGRPLPTDAVHTIIWSE